MMPIEKEQRELLADWLGRIKRAQVAHISVRVATGIASVLAAILAGLQTFLRYSERAERHRVGAGKYGVLRREMEQKLAFPLPNTVELENYVNALRTAWDSLSEESPPVPQKIWNSAEINEEEKVSGTVSL
jgi:hypothetical protein